MARSSRERLAHLVYLLTEFPEQIVPNLAVVLVVNVALVYGAIRAWGAEYRALGLLLGSVAVVAMLRLWHSAGRPYEPPPAPSLSLGEYERRVDEIVRMAPRLAGIAGEAKARRRRRMLRVL